MPENIAGMFYLISMMQNDADSTTTLRIAWIGQNSEMVWQATTDSSDR